MAYQLFHLPKPIALDTAANVYPGAKLNFYLTTTTTPTDTYTTSALSVAHANPVVADSAGVFPAIYLNPSILYKVTYTTAADVLIYTIDPVNDSVLSESTIGEILYPLSAAEQSATLDESDIESFTKPHGYITRYWSGSGSIATAWAAADAQSAAGGAPIYVPRAAGGYDTATPLTVDYRSDLVFEPGAYVNYTGSSNVAVLTIGSTSVSEPAFSRRYERLNVLRTSQSDWTSESNIGIRFHNISNSHISIVNIGKFTIGLQTMPSNGAGFQYNDVHLGALFGNKYQIDLSGAANGYTNENNWYGGRLTNFSGTNSSLARYGVRVTSSDASYLEHNNNVFYKPSFELGAADAAAEAVCVLMEHGTQNHFLKCRDEDNDTPFARESNASSENIYHVGYAGYVSPPIIESSSSAPVFVAIGPRSEMLQSPSRLVFDTGPMHKRACFYDGGTNIHVPDVSISDSGSAAVFTNLNGITLNAAYLDTTRGFAVFINSTDCKQFFVTRDCETGRGGRVVVNCYDSGGSLITTAGSVKGTLSAGITSTSAYGGAFTTGADSNGDVFFTVTSAVKSIRVSVAQGTSSLRIRSFAVHTINAINHAWSWPGYAEAHPGQNIGTAAPTAGTWERGRIVWNDTPAAAGTPGWVCTTAGTPGTWKAMANVAA